MKYEIYRRAAIGDLPYIENLLLSDPSLIDVPYDGYDDTNDSFSMRALMAYSSLKLGHYSGLVGTKMSDWGHYFLGDRFFDLFVNSLGRAACCVAPKVVQNIMVARLIFSSAELAATWTVIYHKRYLREHRRWSLLDFAVENGQSDVAVFLISKGAKLDPKKLFDIAKINRRGGKFLILLTQAIKDRAEKEKLKNDNLILQKSLEEALTYAEILLKEYEEKQIAQGDENSWYADEDINTLLRYYFLITQNNVRTLPALEWNDSSANIRMFIQTRFTNAMGYHPDCFVYFLPLQINQNHWIGLYVDRTPQNERIWWMDPMGGMAEEWKIQIVDILNTAELFENSINVTHVDHLTDRLQNDGFNCGAWVIELLKFFADNKRFPVAGEIDIGAKRQEHLAILNPNQPSKALELQGTSKKLDGFGVFGGQTSAGIGPYTQTDLSKMAKL